MQWIPEVTAVDRLRQEPIDRIDRIQKERWELVCCCCKQKVGARGLKKLLLDKCHACCTATGL
jgi:hypothetical protein